jgi:NADH-quinone oxidoreductase subunit D
MHGAAEKSEASGTSEARELSRTIQYEYHPGHLSASEPGKWKAEDCGPEASLLSLGPQHPSTHGVLRLELMMEGELVTACEPHIGYLHRCFEKHAEALPFPQIIPYVDRMDYLAAMNSEHVFAMAVEKALGISTEIPPRVEYIRILLAELNRIASHFVAIGTYGIDLGAVTPFLWLMRDREHILRLLEWASGARMLYNFIWVGGLFYDLPPGFEEKTAQFVSYLDSRLDELEDLLINNEIFIARTAGIGVLPVSLAVNAGITGPMLRACGLARDLRKEAGYSRYSSLEFHVPVGTGAKGVRGDCWDRSWVRFAECRESVRIIRQCVDFLIGPFAGNSGFNPQAACPKKVRPAEGDYFFSGETPRGQLSFFFTCDGKSDVPLRLKARTPSFCNLSALPLMSSNILLADFIAVVGSLDLVMGEVDR